MIELFLLSTISFVGGYVVGLTGFGFVLICVPLFTLLIDVKFAIVVSVILGWLSCIPLTIKLYSFVQHKVVLLLFLAAIPGSVIGTHVLDVVPSNYIVIAMALVIITSSTYCLRFKSSQKQASSTRVTLSTGFAAGVLSASVGEGGPPIVSYSLMQPWSAQQAKATMVAFFVLTMATTIISFYVEGLLNQQHLTLTLKLIPSLCVGLISGWLSFAFTQRKGINFQGIMHVLLIFLGTYLLVKTIY
ncbi:sulfite exporter TauE/SafE family protein [Vibrio splendidus]|uniref:sulfite exporter TauE/SafE family protein n=1 Tax=Vibrio splendidus TaxID=29497 RepID=UPI000E328124|nr:sulfite exporter TauE/SafE family protein [Vibrio splendidus]